MNIDKIIGEKLSQRGWSQMQLARESGITQGQISRFLNGDSTNLTLFSLRKLAKAFGCAVVDLLPDEDKNPPHHQH